jgi:hypothetical protein
MSGNNDHISQKVPELFNIKKKSLQMHVTQSHTSQGLSVSSLNDQIIKNQHAQVKGLV